MLWKSFGWIIKEVINKEKHLRKTISPVWFLLRAVGIALLVERLNLSFH